MRLNYQSYGEGPPLIILHGLFGSLDNWHTLSKRFGRDFMVFTLDLRNHGRSPHSEEFDYTLMAEDLKEFIDLRSAGGVNLIGHSMGGKTAMQFALTYPESLERLIVVDIAPKAYPPHHNQIIDALYSLDLKSLHSRGEVDAALAEKIPDSAVRQFLMKNLKRDDQGAFAWKVNLDSIHKNYDAINRGFGDDARCEKPTLFIKGGKSNYILEEDTPLIMRIFPRARIETITHAGHWVHAEAPDEFYDTVVNFLRA